jgi:diguanylate cyclase (GGDEF)-like protein/PAS domain S-box-containing protein
MKAPSGFRTWLTFAVLVCAAGTAVALTLLTHQREEEAAAQSRFASQNEWLRLFVISELQEGDQQHLRRVVLDWADKDADLREVRITGPDGSLVVDFRRPESARPTLRNEQKIRYGNDQEAVLAVASEASQMVVAQDVAWRVTVLFVAFCLLVGVLLRQKLLRQRETQVLRARTEEWHRARDAIARIEEHQRLILDACAEGIFGMDENGRCTFINPAAARMLGLAEPGAIIGADIHATIHHSYPNGQPYPKESCRSHLAILDALPMHADDEVYWRPDGTAFPVEYRSVPMVRDGKVIGSVTTFEDITARTAAGRELRKLQRAVEQSPVSVVITDTRGVIEYVNPSFERNSGYTRDEVLGRPARMLKSGQNPPAVYAELWNALSQDRNWTGELCSKRKDGSVYWERASMSPVKAADGTTTHYLAVKEDITRERELTERLRYQAEYDALTGIPNRVLTFDRLAQALAHGRRAGKRVALLFIDLDNFKLVNDTLGHETGDRLLVEAATRFREVVREADTVGRHGGDEFLIIIENAVTHDAAERVARDIVHSLARPFHLRGADLQVTSSIGVALFPEDGIDAPTLLRNADIAMYAAKESGRNGFRFFQPAMNQAVNERVEVERWLAGALGQGELALDYQPQIELASGRVACVEVLLRWNSPILGSLSPHQFVPVAEQTGAIVAIGEWLFDSACRQLRQWRADGHSELRVAVNVSARQLRLQAGESSLVSIIEQALRRHGLPADALELEITEGLLIRAEDAARTALAAMHGTGIRLVMDDFGTGYSSLACLRELPFQVVKIDCSVVRNIANDADDRALVGAIVSMAKSLHMRTVAEGVEDEVQLGILRRAGCDLAQGYFYGRPMSGERLTRFLADFAHGPDVIA